MPGTVLWHQDQPVSVKSDSVTHHFRAASSKLPSENILWLYWLLNHLGVVLDFATGSGPWLVID